jgi:single-strand DNA-binding protein
MYLNKAIIIGNLTRDPEMRALPTGTPVASFSVATSRFWKDKNGVKQEDTQFHNVVVFGPQADSVSRYLKKGSSVLVEGRMQTRSWDSTDGKKYRTEIVAERIQFGPRPMSGDAAAPNGEAAADSSSAKATEPLLDTIEYPEEDINPDDIPF